jgi:hypothetical protein
MNTAILNLMLLALTKIFDNTIMVWKSISTYRGQKLISSILVTVSQLMFYFIVKRVVDDDTVATMIIISIASGLGNYIGFIINDKFKKDILWLNILTCSDREDITHLCNYLIDKKIRYVVNTSFTRGWIETYSVMIFAKTKNESKLIDKFISKSNVKYMREIIR